MAEKQLDDCDGSLPAGLAPARLTLFGEFALAGPDGRAVALPNRRARALLAILALAPGQSLARETITGLLWPGRFEAQARASLRQCLLELGKILDTHGCTILSVARDAVALNPVCVTSDLAELDLALAVGDVELVRCILGGIGAKRLLGPMQFGDEFARWLNARRAEVDARIGASIGEAVDRLQRAGNAPTATRLAQAWAVRGAQGQRPEPGAGDDRIRIAVMPFQALGVPEGQDYFADGIVDELITTLGQVQQMRVAGRASAFHFRGSTLAPAAIAQTLGVEHLVEGSVQRQGERVRIFVRLIDGANGFERWGERYDGTLDAIFQLQENVAQAVTRAIAAALNIAIPAPEVRSMTHSKEAYDLYLQGQSLCAKRFGEGVLDTAVTLFKRALALDPEFAECWVALAEAHQLVSVYTQCPDRNGEAAKMAECAHRAIALAPGLAYAYSLLGVYELTRFNFTGGLDYGYQAYRLDPNDPAVQMRLAYFLIFIGRTRDAVPYIKAAVDQDPVDGRKYALLWCVQFCMGELEAATISAQRMVDLGMPSIHQGLNSAVQGQHDRAIEQYLQTQSMVNDMILPPVGIGIQTPEAMDAYWMLAAKGICGGKEEYREQYGQVLEMLFAVLHDKSDIAISGPAVMIGNVDLVFRTYGLSITPSNLMGLVPLWTEVEPMCRIWQDPEFIPFAQRIGMAAAWDKYGWPDLLPVPTNRA